MRRHPVDALALVAGVVVLLAVAGWSLWWTDVIPGHAYSWLVPAGLLLAGGGGIAASLWSPARSGTVDDEAPA